MSTQTGSIDLKGVNKSSQTASKYITEIKNDGIRIHEDNFNATNYDKNIVINSSGINMNYGNLPSMTLDNNSLDFNMVNTTNNTYTNIASFGETSRIGNSNISYVEISPYKMQYVRAESSPIPSGNPSSIPTPYFVLEDIRGSGGIATLSASFIGNGTKTEFDVGVSIFDIINVTIDGSETSLYRFQSANSYITFTRAPDPNSTIIINYRSRDTLLKQLTFGKRKANNIIGGMTVSFGNQNVVSGTYAFAQGEDNTASGSSSFAQGIHTLADQNCSHAEGYTTRAYGIGSHAEGYDTEARGDYSHTEGESTYAYGPYSHAEGAHSIALSGYAHAGGIATVATYNQMAIGSYNIVDNNSDYSFIIGNGTEESGEVVRSNAFMVDKTGDIYPQATKMSDFTTAQGSVAGNHGTWYYRKWKNGMVEAWYNMDTALSVSFSGSSVANTYRTSSSITIPSDIFSTTPIFGYVNTTQSGTTIHANIRPDSATTATVYWTRDATGTANITANIYLMGFDS